MLPHGAIGKGNKRAALGQRSNAINADHKRQSAVETVMLTGSATFHHMADGGGIHFYQGVTGIGLRIGKIGPDRTLLQIKNYGCFHNVIS
jgi:hypothetical protein